MEKILMSNLEKLEGKRTTIVDSTKYGSIAAQEGVEKVDEWPPYLNVKYDGMTLHDWKRISEAINAGLYIDLGLSGEIKDPIVVYGLPTALPTKESGAPDIDMPCAGFPSPFNGAILTGGEAYEVCVIDSARLGSDKNYAGVFKQVFGLDQPVSARYLGMGGFEFNFGLDADKEHLDIHQYLAELEKKGLTDYSAIDNLELMDTAFDSHFELRGQPAILISGKDSALVKSFKTMKYLLESPLVGLALK